MSLIKNNTVKFHEMGLDDRILEAIARLKWQEPTLIQEKAIPYFLKGKDILARARTGSGKTGAYLIPLIHKILEHKPHDIRQSTSALILSPSKELCKQIASHISQLTTLCKKEIRCVDVSLQVPLEAQRPLLLDNPDIVVGTPLKVLGHMNQSNLSLKKSLRYLIIDEADLMMAFDHEKDLEAVLAKLPSIRQSFLTSATMHTDVKELKNLVLNKPVLLKLEEPPLPDTDQLTQYVIKVEEFDKVILLYALIRMNLLRGKILIFVNTVNKGYKIRMFLSLFGIRTCVLNAELPVNSRTHIVDEFNRGKYNILIASDDMNQKPTKRQGSKSKTKKDRESGVSRGIDFNLVSNVVNLDFPVDPLTYVHRVGRTARGPHQVGAALSFVCRRELKVFRRVEKELISFSPDSGDENGEKKQIFKDYKFNMAALDGFRYRAGDAWKQCTSIAVRDLRKRELKSEILASQKLKTFFEDNPQDLEAIKHDVKGKGIPVIEHMHNVPEYNVPEALKEVVQHGPRKKPRRNKFRLKAQDNSKTKYLKRLQDPLRSHHFSGFKK